MSAPYIKAQYDEETRFEIGEMEAVPMELPEAVQRMSEIQVAQALAGSGMF